MRAEEFAALAVTWEGVPYHHQGRTRVGCDCVGLILGVLTEAGALPDHVRPRKDYGHRPMRELVEELSKYCEPRKNTDGPEVGGLVSIRWQRNERPGHLAIFAPPRSAGDGTLCVVHSHIQSGRVVVNSYDGFWKRHTVGFWRVPGIEY